LGGVIEAFHDRSDKREEQAANRHSTLRFRRWRADVARDVTDDGMRRRRTSLGRLEHRSRQRTLIVDPPR
jgi:hypothetical protein